MRKVNFEDIITYVLSPAIEGGYKNDPDDPGGETKYGISKRSFPEEDIMNLKEERAKKLYFDHYWEKYKVYEMPTLIRAVFLDMCINMGYTRAVKVVQEAANLHKFDLVVDGIWGPITDRNIRRAPRTFYVDITLVRIEFYNDLCKSKPVMRKYLVGWIDRSLKIMRIHD